MHNPGTNNIKTVRMYAPNALQAEKPCTSPRLFNHMTKVQSPTAMSTTENPIAAIPSGEITLICSNIGTVNNSFPKISNLGIHNGKKKIVGIEAHAIAALTSSDVACPPNHLPAPRRSSPVMYKETIP